MSFFGVVGPKVVNVTEWGLCTADLNRAMCAGRFLALTRLFIDVNVLTLKRVSLAQGTIRLSKSIVLDLTRGGASIVFFNEFVLLCMSVRARKLPMAPAVLGL